MKTSYSIGEFSQITGLSVKTLRFYHEKGILIPTSVDEATGYRFYDAAKVEKARVSMYFNGKLVHDNVEISQVWGGPNSGIDGGNDGGKGITDTPGGLKLQCEGHDVRYRNTWIKELDLKDLNTDF